MISRGWAPHSVTRPPMESRSGRVLIRPASVALLPNAHVEQVLSRGTLDFVEEVAVKFQPQLLALLVERERIEQRLNTSQDVPRFRPDTAHIRLVRGRLAAVVAPTGQV